MLSVFRQIRSATWLSLSSIPSRAGLSISTALAIALVVGVLLVFLAMADGFQRVVEGTGSDDVAVVLRSGASAELNSGLSRDQARLIEQMPGVAKDASGAPIASPELYVVVDGIKRSSQTEVNLPLRGVSPAGPALREGLTIVDGRMFEPGANELVVGQGVLREFDGYELGRTVTLGLTEWTVVGVFALNGSVFESEIWADLPTVQNLFRRGSSVQTVRVQLTSPEAIEELRVAIEAEPRLNAEVKSENEFFAEQSSGTINLIKIFGWPLAITMALGALAGALNTMYSSVQARTREIATLRAIGFGGFPAFVGAMVESLVLAAAGGLIGSLVTFLIFDGLSAATIGGGFTQIVFSFDVSAAALMNGLILALTVGALGGFLPAIRAARAPLLAVHQE